MALVMQHGQPKTVRANLSVYFSYSCTLSLAGYAWMGLLSMEVLVSTLSFIPLALLGFFTGIKARAYVDAGRFRPLLLWLCGCTGVFALLGALSKF